MLSVITTALLVIATFAAFVAMGALLFGAIFLTPTLYKMCKSTRKGTLK